MTCDSLFIYYKDDLRNVRKSSMTKQVKEVKKFVCDKCAFASVWRVSLQEHVESVHERKNVYRSAEFVLINLALYTFLDKLTKPTGLKEIIVL